MSTSVEQEYIFEWEPEDLANDFFNKVRVDGKWDERHFRKMLSTADALLNELSASGFDRNRWDFSFTEQIAILIGLLGHPGFLAENGLGMSATEFSSYIAERVAQLQALRARYESLCHSPPIQTD